MKFLSGIVEVLAGHDGQEAVMRDEPFRSSDRMPQHRTGAQQGAVLFRTLGAQVRSEERPKSLSLTPGEDDAP